MPYPRRRYAGPRRRARAARSRPRGRKNVFTRRARKPNLQGFVSGMPLVRSANLRYNTQIAVTTTAGSLGYHVFSANSIHDPDTTGIGHQPMGHDQWKELYNHYTVVGSRISCNVLASTPSTSAPTQMAPFVCGLNLTDTPTPPYTGAQATSQFIESKKGTWKIMGTGPGGRGSQRITSKFSCKQFFKIANPSDNTERVGAQMGASPTETADYVLWVQSFGATPPGDNTIYVNVTIDYAVIFGEPKDLVQS